MYSLLLKTKRTKNVCLDKATICPINQSVLCVYFQDCTPLPATMAKSTFLDILSKWPLFGSTFFLIKSVADSRVEGECHLAINKDGVHFLRAKTHVSSPPPKNEMFYFEKVGYEKMLPQAIAQVSVFSKHRPVFHKTKYTHHRFCYHFE